MKTNFAIRYLKALCIYFLILKARIELLILFSVSQFYVLYYEHNIVLKFHYFRHTTHQAHPQKRKREVRAKL